MPDVASFGPFFIVVGLCWPAWAAVGLHFDCCGPALAVLGLRWLLWTVVGCCGLSLAAVDVRFPALAVLGLCWLLWAIVVAFVGIIQAKGGYVDVVW